MSDTSFRVITDYQEEPPINNCACAEPVFEIVVDNQEEPVAQDCACA